jgi:N-acetylmuramic acid 6-phosphate etherase
VTYIADSYYLQCVFTDTTERSPTFSLAPFEKEAGDEPSWVWVRGSESSGDKGWRAILNRPLRALDSAYWERYKAKVSS